MTDSTTTDSECGRCGVFHRGVCYEPDVLEPCPFCDSLYCHIGCNQQLFAKGDHVTSGDMAGIVNRVKWNKADGFTYVVTFTHMGLTRIWDETRTCSGGKLTRAERGGGQYCIDKKKGIS